MNEVVLYLVKSLLAGALLYGFYQVAMRRELISGLTGTTWFAPHCL